MNNKNEDVPGASHQSIKMDLLMFKDEILKDMRSIQRTLDAKYIKVGDNISSKISTFESKISIFEQKIFELSNKINTDNKIREEIESLNKFKEDTSDMIFKRRAKYNEFEKYMSEEISRINNILIDSVVYPAIIGNNTKFKTFHEFIDYTLVEIGQLNLYKDKTGLDIGPYKKRIDQSIDALKIQMTNIGNISKEFTTSSINQCEERIKSLLSIYDEKLQNFLTKRTMFEKNLEKKMEELNNEMNRIKKNHENLKERHIKDNNTYKESLKYYNNEIILMNNKINKMNNIIKVILDFLFSNNHQNGQKNEKKAKIYSGVKQYIKGMLNANELSSMKNFKKVEDNSFGANIKRSGTEFHKSNNFMDSFKKKENNYLSQYSSGFIENNNMHVIRDIFQAINKNEKKKENSLIRRLSCNYSNVNDNSIKNNDDNETKKNNTLTRNSRKKEFIKKVSNDKIRNSLKLFNNSDVSNDSKKQSLLNLSQDSNDNDIMSIKSKAKEQYIIKEEDENNMSENSFIKIKEDAKTNLKREKEKDKNKNRNKNQINNENKAKPPNHIINNNKKDNKENKDKNNKEKNKDINKFHINNNSNENIKNNKENKKPIINQKENKIYKEDNKNNNKTNNINNNNKDNSNIIIKKDNINCKPLENNNNTQPNNNKIKNDKIIYNNSFFSPIKTDKNMHYTNDINSRNGLNSLRTSNDSNNKNIPLIELSKFGQNDNLIKARCQSSKKRTKTNVIYYKNNNDDYYKFIKKDNGKIFNSYSNVYCNTNINLKLNNNAYQNFPNINKEIIRQKIESIPNSALTKTKLIKFNNMDNISQTNKPSTNNSVNKPKKLILGNSDNMFSNIIASKRNKKIIRNKSFGIGNERNNEAREIEDMFYNLQSYIPNYNSNLPQEEYVKPFKNLKSYKSPHK
jgi:hypothetical protein